MAEEIIRRTQDWYYSRVGSKSFILQPLITAISFHHGRVRNTFHITEDHNIYGHSFELKSCLPIDGIIEDTVDIEKVLESIFIEGGMIPGVFTIIDMEVGAKERLKKLYNLELRCLTTIKEIRLAI